MAVTVTTLKKMKQAGDKITWLTAYDYSFAHAIEQAGVDTILVGDSLLLVTFLSVVIRSVRNRHMRMQ